MSDLLAEVDEMMRQERMVALWKKHGGTLISAIAAIIIGTGAASAYKVWDQDQRIESTEQLLTVVNDDAFPQNIEENALDMRPGLKGIALMTAASEFIGEGENEKAVALYQQALTNSDIPQDLRDLAALNIAKLGSDPAVEKLALLSSVTANDNSPWRHQAILQSAVILAHDQNNYQSALSTLDGILKTPNLPNTMYTKAQSLIQVYTMKMENKDQSS
ncbi:MAG: hypothetical protein AAF182_00035 [Pseudomonadota bacterium]